MLKDREAQLHKLCTKLGYEFKDFNLLNVALTHRSVSGKNNERLEFLGDSIVNFVIAEVLFKEESRANEGELSRLRASLVKGETLAEVTKELDLGKYLLLGSGELKSGGRERISILADVMEAIIAAIYLDGGMEACKERILCWFDSRIHEALLKKEIKDSKTQLQEFLQSQGRLLPVYTVLDVQGQSHEQVFYVQCTLPDTEENTKAQGANRRSAEQDAAKAMLQKLGVI